MSKNFQNILKSTFEVHKLKLPHPPPTCCCSGKRKYIPVILLLNRQLLQCLKEHFLGGRNVLNQ